MPQPKLIPPTRYLRECFAYDPASADLTWRKRPLRHFKHTHAWQTWNTRYAGTRAGGTTHRYVNLNKSAYMVHRIIWKMMTGKQPPRIIDHIDGNPRNNRWVNLRTATPLESTQNRGNNKKTNTTGFRGVYRALRSKGWQAKVGIPGGYRYLGTFPTREAAAAAYEVAAREMFGAFYRPPHLR